MAIQKPDYHSAQSFPVWYRLAVHLLDGRFGVFIANNFVDCLHDPRLDGVYCTVDSLMSSSLTFGNLSNGGDIFDWVKTDVECFENWNSTEVRGWFYNLIVSQF